MSLGNLGRDLRKLKIWLTYGSELLWIRVRMLRLDAIAQLQSIITLLVLIMLAGLMFFLGFISLLFGLNTLLTPQAKIWVFFGIAILFLLLILLMSIAIIKLLRKQSQFMTETLAAINEDINYLKHTSDTKGNGEH
ncbi:MAG: phage holin family protein [Snodgrassella sp.]|uniref:phage holin family protein n=1 Tax=Snodgrassella TaxID=1193515 RepID=UPI0008162884|nr:MULTISPECIES: phage holin family protein [Snodgrassella]MCO6505759.1 phage holin family protein [Snodgrassella sp.]MCO6518411.1 phage holin family protein [Snodgrassella sp.]MCO6522710.1 phage holin family protein [Snodgrassella sp.]SCB97783.1 Putative Holin-X, holin superfamily III [Snodgrassella sp. R-53583]